jgi:O-antigen/teichoic acid export membrane protein
MSDHSKKLVRHTILYFPAQFFPPLVQFATMIAWTYLLQPAGFGIVTFVIAAQEFTAMLGITWWSLFVLRFRARFAKAGEQRLRLMDSLIAVCAIAVQTALSLPMLWLAGASLDWAIFLSTAGFFISRTLLVHYGEWARADHLIGAFTTSQLIGSVVGSGLSIVALMVFGPLPSAALGAQAAGNLLALVVLFGQAKLRLRWGTFDQAIFGDAMTYSAPLIVSGGLAWVATNCIRVLVQFSEGAVGLGLLSVGWGLGQRIASVLAMLFTAATYPLAVSNLEGGDRKGALAQVSLNGVFLLTFLTPTVAGAALLSSPLVTIMISAQFRDMTIMILPIAILAAAVRALRIHTSDQTMILLERTRVTMYANLFEAVVNVVFCAVGLYLGGIVGAAVGVLAGTIAACIASFAYSFLRLGLPAPSGWTLMRIVLATAVMSAVVRLLPAPVNSMTLVLTVAAGATAYAGMIILTFAECRAMIGPIAAKCRSMMLASFVRPSGNPIDR